MTLPEAATHYCTWQEATGSKGKGKSKTPKQKVTSYADAVLFYYAEADLPFLDTGAVAVEGKRNFGEHHPYKP